MHILKLLTRNNNIRCCKVPFFSLPTAPLDLYKVPLLPFYSCVNLSVAALIVLALDLSH